MHGASCIEVAFVTLNIAFLRRTVLGYMSLMRQVKYRSAFVYHI
jgi:hypothetical protein